MAKTLLLADDSVTIQRVIELSFAHEDIRVVSVGDGRRAMQWIDAERPDIVVADVGVPEVDGYGIVAHVKKSANLRHIPVMLLAGAFEPVDEGRARSIGCDGILVKPFEPQQLVARVKELLNESQRWSPAARPQVAVNGGPHVPMPAPAPAAKNTFEPSGPSLSGPVPFTAAPALHVVSASNRMITSAFESEAPADRLDIDHVSAVEVADTLAGPEPLLPPAEPIWSTPLAGMRQAAADLAAPQKVSLSNAFSALLAAEQTRPSAPAQAAAPEIPEAAIEEAVRRILARMTGEAVRQVVLDTAERLIREEIEKLKANTE